MVGGREVGKRREALIGGQVVAGRDSETALTAGVISAAAVPHLDNVARMAHDRR
jgi:hypothetical protein